MAKREFNVFTAFCHRLGKRLAHTLLAWVAYRTEPAHSTCSCSSAPSSTPRHRRPSRRRCSLPLVAGRIPSSAYRSARPGLFPAGSPAQRSSSRHEVRLASPWQWRAQQEAVEARARSRTDAPSLHGYTYQAGMPGGVGPWDGVRNHQAMNNLRAMRRGDRCLYYHSGAGAVSRRVVGVVEVAREWYEGEEGEATAGGSVDVRAVGDFQRPVALGEIKKKKAAGEVEGMKDFALIRQAWLSVMPVPVAVWDWICEMGFGFVRDAEVGDEDESEG